MRGQIVEKERTNTKVMSSAPKKEVKAKNTKTSLAPLNQDSKSRQPSGRPTEKSAAAASTTPVAGGGGVSRLKKLTLNNEALQLPPLDEEALAAPPTAVEDEKGVPATLPTGGASSGAPKTPPLQKKALAEDVSPEPLRSNAVDASLSDVENQQIFHTAKDAKRPENLRESDLQYRKTSLLTPSGASRRSEGSERLSIHRLSSPSATFSHFLFQQVSFDAGGRRDFLNAGGNSYHGTSPAGIGPERLSSFAGTPSASGSGSPRASRGNSLMDISPSAAGTAFLSEPRSPRKSHAFSPSAHGYTIDKALLDSIKRGYRWQVIIFLALAQQRLQREIRVGPLRAVLQKKLLPVLEQRKEETGFTVSREAFKTIKRARKQHPDLLPLVPNAKFMAESYPLFADFNSPALINLIAEKMEVTTYSLGALVAGSGEPAQEVLRFIVTGKVKFTPQEETQPLVLPSSFFEKKEECESDGTEGGGKKAQKTVAGNRFREGIESAQGLYNANHGSSVPNNGPLHVNPSGGKRPKSPSVDGAAPVPGSAPPSGRVAVGYGGGVNGGLGNPSGAGTDVASVVVMATQSGTAKGKRKKDAVPNSFATLKAFPSAVYPIRIPESVMNDLSPSEKPTPFRRHGGGTREKKTVALLSGDYFGGLFGISSILEGSYRVFTPTCVIWSLPRKVFEEVFFSFADEAMKATYIRHFRATGEAYISRAYPLPTTLLRVSIYRKLNRSLNRYTEDFTPCVFFRGEKLFDQDEPAGCVYCVLEGALLRRVRGFDGTFSTGISQLLVLNSAVNAGRFLLVGCGELIMPATRRYQCMVCSPYALCFRVTAERFVSALLDDPNLFVQLRERLTQQIRLNMRLDPVCLKFAPLLKDFPDSSLAVIAQAAEARVLRRSVPLCEPAHSIKEIFLVVRGGIRDTRVFGKRPTRRLDTPPPTEDGNGDHFGEEHLGGGGGGHVGRVRSQSFTNGPAFSNTNSSGQKRGILQSNKVPVFGGTTTSVEGGVNAVTNNGARRSVSAEGKTGGGAESKHKGVGTSPGNAGGSGGGIMGGKRTNPAGGGSGNGTTVGVEVPVEAGGGGFDSLDIFTPEHVAEELLLRISFVTPDEQIELNPPLPLLPDKRFEVTVGGGWEGLLIDKWPSGWEGTCTVEAWALPVLKIRAEFNNLSKPYQNYVLNYLRYQQKEALGLPKIVVAKLPPMSSYNMHVDRVGVAGSAGVGKGGTTSASSGQGGTVSLGSNFAVDSHSSRKKARVGEGGSGVPSSHHRSTERSRSRSHTVAGSNSFMEDSSNEQTWGSAQFAELDRHSGRRSSSTGERGEKERPTSRQRSPSGSKPRRSSSLHHDKKRRKRVPKRNYNDNGEKMAPSCSTASDTERRRGRDNRPHRGTRPRSQDANGEDALPSLKSKPATHTYMFTGGRKQHGPTSSHGGTASHTLSSPASLSSPPVDPYLLAVYNGDFKDGELALSNIERDPVSTDDAKNLLRHCPDLTQENLRGNRWPIIRRPDHRWFAVVPSYGPLPGTIQNPNLAVPPPDFSRNSDLMIRKDKQYREKLLAETNFFSQSMRCNQELSGRESQGGSGRKIGTTGSDAAYVEGTNGGRTSPSPTLNASSSGAAAVPKRFALV